MVNKDFHTAGSECKYPVREDAIIIAAFMLAQLKYTMAFMNRTAAAVLYQGFIFGHSHSDRFMAK